MKDKLFRREVAQAAADALIALISPACQQVSLAGSLRRGKPEVHDIDLVVWAKFSEVEVGTASLFEPAPTVPYPTALAALLNRECVPVHIPPAPASPVSPGYPRIIAFEWRGILAELYLAEVDGGNFGALLQMRTGSKDFNIRLAQRAQALGLVYRAGHGVYQPLLTGAPVCLASGAEEDVFAALNLPFIRPEDREGGIMFPTRS